MGTNSIGPGQGSRETKKHTKPCMTGCNCYLYLLYWPLLDFGLIIGSGRQRSYVLRMNERRQNYVRQQREKLNTSVLKLNATLQKTTSKRQPCKSTLVRCQSCYFMRTCAIQNQKRKYVR